MSLARARFALDEGGLMKLFGQWTDRQAQPSNHWRSQRMSLPIEVGHEADAEQSSERRNARMRLIQQLADLSSDDRRPRNAETAPLNWLTFASGSEERLAAVWRDVKEMKPAPHSSEGRKPKSEDPSPRKNRIPEFQRRTSNAA